MTINQEPDLIPYRTSDLPESPYLIFSPHPDDETFGMGGTIALAIKEGLEVNVIVVTDGAAGGDVATRRKETHNAALLLGIQNLLFLEHPDRQINISRGTILSFAQLIEKFNPRTIFLPSIFEFHPDHRIVTHLVTKAIELTDFQGSLWLYEISRQSEVNRLIDITNVLDLKRKAMNFYQSQLAQRPYDEYILALNRLRAYTLPEDTKYAEAFWECTNKIDDALFQHIKKYLVETEDTRGLFRHLIRFWKD